MDGLQLQQIAELQRRLLPKKIPTPDGWCIAAYNSIASRPGGDYYDIFELPDGRLFLIIADASGHGGPSAVMVALTRMIIHSCPLSSGIKRAPFCPLYHPVVQPPNVLLEHLNNVVQENCLPDQFMTAFCGTLDPERGELQYANAGHPPPIFWRRNGAAIESLPDVTGLPLCIEKGSEYRLGKVTFEPGDIFVAHTDGASEAMSPKGELFGTQRLIQAVWASARQGADAVKQALLDSLHSFVGDGEPDDDVTFLLVERMRE